ncbi:hypothetical protein ACFSKY_06435 [Azotobacter chroococcum]|uniref:Uncharacterized protein n=1 Tax=Azotobacter chroococcum TaxID=353 RepID=A0A4R1PP24_9GAMM|nr:hypothetical protein [Azotobacter chroococcum]TCL32503.1 hypothetical protein EV691_10729 [Azotobacter chroococcum]
MKRNSTSIRLIGRAGVVIGWLSLPSTARVADLVHLRALGAVRVEVMA